MLNSVNECALKSNFDENVQDSGYEKLDKVTEKIENGSTQKFVIVKFGLETYDTHLSLEKLTYYFAYFNKKRNLKFFKENGYIINVSGISKESFKALFELVHDG